MAESYQQLNLVSSRLDSVITGVYRPARIAEDGFNV
jgi:hypothetical protein